MEVNFPRQILPEPILCPIPCPGVFIWWAYVFMRLRIVMIGVYYLCSLKEIPRPTSHLSVLLVLCTSSSPLRSQEAHLQHLERPRGDPHTAVHPAPAGEVQRHRHRPRVQLRPEGVQQSGVFGPRPVCRWASMPPCGSRAALCFCWRASVWASLPFCSTCILCKLAKKQNKYFDLGMLLFFGMLLLRMHWTTIYF